VLDTLALVRLARGEAREALATADRALRRAAPELRPHLEYLRAEALYALARPAEAQRALRGALASQAAADTEWRDDAQALSDRLARRPTEPSSTRVE